MGPPDKPGDDGENRTGRGNAMLKWKVGDVTVTRVVEMELPIPYSEDHAFLKQATPDVLQTMPWLFPHFVTPEGAMILSFHALLVDAPGMRVMVDTCIGNDKPRKELGMQALSTPFMPLMAVPLGMAAKRPFTAGGKTEPDKWDGFFYQPFNWRGFYDFGRRFKLGHQAVQFGRSYGCHLLYLAVAPSDPCFTMPRAAPALSIAAGSCESQRLKSSAGSE